MLRKFRKILQTKFNICRKIEISFLNLSIRLALSHIRMNMIKINLKRFFFTYIFFFAASAYKYVYVDYYIVLHKCIPYYTVRIAQQYLFTQEIQVNILYLAIIAITVTNYLYLILLYIILSLFIQFINSDYGTIKHWNCIQNKTWFF